MPQNTFLCTHIAVRPPPSSATTAPESFTLQGLMETCKNCKSSRAGACSMVSPMEEPFGQLPTVKPEGTYRTHLSEHVVWKKTPQLVDHTWVLHLPHFSISKWKHFLETILVFYWKLWKREPNFWSFSQATTHGNAFSKKVILPLRRNFHAIKWEGGKKTVFAVSFFLCLHIHTQMSSLLTPLL